MLSVTQCKNKIQAIERQIIKLQKANPTQADIEFIEQLKRLKIAYAIEMAKAIDRRGNGTDEESYS